MTLINPNFQDSKKVVPHEDLFLDFTINKGYNLRHDWSLEEIKEILDLTIKKIPRRAKIIHRYHSTGYKVLIETL